MEKYHPISKSVIISPLKPLNLRITSNALRIQKDFSLHIGKLKIIFIDGRIFELIPSLRIDFSSYHFPYRFSYKPS